MAAPRVALKVRLGLWLWRHGVAVPLAALMLLAAALLAWQATRPGPVLPAVVAPRQSAPPPAGAEAAAAMAALHAVLLPADEATAAVRRLVTLTQPELAWQRAEFAQSEDAAPGVARLQITVPVSGEYRAVREALQRALLEMPQLSLDQVRLQREAGAGITLEAQLRFSLWLRAAGTK
jgi:hypothetical protein